MFLHQNTTPMTRALLCAASRQAVFTYPRCASKSCKFPMHCQVVNISLTVQHAKWHWWPRQQQEFNKTYKRYQIPVGVISSNAAQYSTGDTISVQSNSTSKADVLPGTLDIAEKDEIDLEALVHLEIELNRQEGVRMPSEITPTQWQELLTKGSPSGRRKYLLYLFKIEMKKENRRKLQQIKKEKREEAERLKKDNPTQGSEHIEYGLWRNSIFLKVLDPTVHHFYHCRVVQAMLFGQPLVVDLDYEKHMSSRERQNCAFQVQMMIAANRKHQEPYNLELHNAPPTLDTMARLERFIPVLHKPEYPVNIYTKSYLEKYPKEQLVYLTPHCQEELLEYDHSAVYIIGGLVDKSTGQPFTLAKAKREGICMKKLPLDRYLAWGHGNKCLTLDQMISIMLDFKTTGDWSYALRHVPRRKLHPPSSNQQGREEALLRRIQHKGRRFRSY